MSDTEEEGTFDKEAEKEKLREQLRREEESRRTTQHMSELLLKGATMTNRHCDSCGDPLFRYEGREFCPTCGREPDTDAEPGGAAGEGAAEGSATEEGEAAQSGIADGIDRVRTGSSGETGWSQSEGVEDRPERTVEASASRSAPRPDVDPAEGIEEARDALVRKLVALARQAEATDDVGRSRELLAAAREAAETLDEIEGIGR